MGSAKKGQKGTFPLSTEKKKKTAMIFIGYEAINGCNVFPHLPTCLFSTPFFLFFALSSFFFLPRKENIGIEKKEIVKNHSYCRLGSGLLLGNGLEWGEKKRKRFMKERCFL